MIQSHESIALDKLSLSRAILVKDDCFLGRHYDEQLTMTSATSLGNGAKSAAFSKSSCC